jgi:hypothetical protein
MNYFPCRAAAFIPSRMQRSAALGPFSPKIL